MKWSEITRAESLAFSNSPIQGEALSSERIERIKRLLDGKAPGKLDLATYPASLVAAITNTKKD